MAYWKESNCRVENKWFFIGPDRINKRGRVLLREKNRDLWFSISCEPQIVVWIRDAIDHLIETPQNQRFFRSIECENGMVMINKVTNRRGSFADVSQLLTNGKKSNLFIPSGVDKGGWLNFVKLVDGKFEVDEEGEEKPKQQVHVSKADTFTNVVTKDKTTFAEVVRKRTPVATHGKPSLTEEKRVVREEEVRPLNLKDTIVVIRRSFFDDWGKVLKKIKKCSSTDNFEINPFHPDKAILKCPGNELALNLCQNQGWSTFEGITLKFEWWDIFKHGRIDLLPSNGGWIKVRNIPLIYWSLEVFKVIGDMCGGYIKCSKNTLNRIGSFEAVLQVKENSYGFIPAEVEVRNSDGSGFMTNVVAFQDWKMLERGSPAIRRAHFRQPTSKKTGKGEEGGLYPMDKTRDLWKTVVYCAPRDKPMEKVQHFLTECPFPIKQVAATVVNVPMHNTFGSLFLGKESKFEKGSNSYGRQTVCQVEGKADEEEKDNAYYLNASEEELVNNSLPKSGMGCGPASPLLKKKETLWREVGKRKKDKIENTATITCPKKLTFREKANSKITFKSSVINHTTILNKNTVVESDNEFYYSSPYENGEGDTSNGVIADFHSDEDTLTFVTMFKELEAEETEEGILSPHLSSTSVPEMESLSKLGNMELAIVPETQEAIQMGYDDAIANSASETMFSPAFHVSANPGGENHNAVEFIKFFQGGAGDQDNAMEFNVHGGQDLCEYIRGPEKNYNNALASTNLGGASLSSEVSAIYLAMKKSKLECVDEHAQDTISAEVHVRDEEYEEIDDFDPYFFIKNLPDLSTVVPTYRPMLLPKQTRSCPPTTLVLDLDETLVHSTLDPCDDADFTFPVNFNLQQHTVYVRCRPYLRDFMEMVARHFEIIIFTASQSIYAEQLLNILDPKRKIIRHRVFRESCVFVDGNYLKDLSVLGRDLAHVVIVDNSPQAFGFQVDNGIPIESWFDDRSDKELLLLFPFLETLVGVEDVRPLIANKFNLRQKIAAAVYPSLNSNRDPFERQASNMY